MLCALYYIVGANISTVCLCLCVWCIPRASSTTTLAAATPSTATILWSEGSSSTACGACRAEHCATCFTNQACVLYGTTCTGGGGDYNLLHTFLLTSAVVELMTPSRFVLTSDLHCIPSVSSPLVTSNLQRCLYNRVHPLQTCLVIPSLCLTPLPHRDCMHSRVRLLPAFLAATGWRRCTWMASASTSPPSSRGLPGESFVPPLGAPWQETTLPAGPAALGCVRSAAVHVWGGGDCNCRSTQADGTARGSMMRAE